ncbi:hypothetical protein CHUAL_013251 [Chamberlinius hualienensis]
MFQQIIITIFWILPIITGSLVDITSSVFGANTNEVIAAFGDFNSDKLTDIFVLSNEGKKLEIFLASSEQPYLRPSQLVCSKSQEITSVVPGDFNGDSRLDVLITFSSDSEDKFQILWGSLDALNCSDDEASAYSIVGQPLVLDYDGNKLPDILGEIPGNQRQVWLSSEHGNFTLVNMSLGSNQTFEKPHSHSAVDLNHDLISDLLLTTTVGYEVWYRKDGSLVYNESLSYKKPEKAVIIGQSIFVDPDLDGTMNHILPVCYDSDCLNSSILIWDNKTWKSISWPFNYNGSIWGFIPPSQSSASFQKTINLRVGDYDLDGYPDFLAVLKSNSNTETHKAFIIQNVPCNGCNFGRGFEIVTDSPVLSGFNNVVLAAFYDIYEDGTLDILLVTKLGVNMWSVVALQSNYDSNACFMKVIVLSGLCYTDCQYEKVPYGVNQPGPTICYQITTSDGKPKTGCAGQLTQSAHFSLQLPYLVFGLGHTPNFVDYLKVGVAENDNERKLRHEWSSVIPNSQMVVIPNLISDRNKWINKLFVTPSHQVLITFAVLCGVMGLMLLIILGFHLKEKKEDRREKLKEAHRFHFDAM